MATSQSAPKINLPAPLSRGPRVVRTGDARGQVVVKRPSGCKSSVLLRKHVELLRCGQTSPVVAHLPFADHVHELDATQNDSRTTEVLEALYRACDALDRAMVLLDNVVEVFALSDHDLGAMLPIVVLDSGVVRAALVDVDDLGKAVVLDGAREKAPRRTTIAFGGQQEVDRVSLFIHGTIPIPVLAADLDVRLVQAPTLADRADAPFALPFTEGFLEHRNQLDDPAVNRGMIDEHAALLHHLFQVAQTQRVRDVPSHAQQHDVQWKAQPLDHASDAVHDRPFVTSSTSTAAT